MIDAIDAVSSNSNSTVDYTPTFHTKPAAPAQDSVTLSIDAQAQLLEQQGLSVGEIANQLGVTASTVQTDLGIAIISAQTKVATA
jgi:DNA-binding NarL/FixJ family response regulator